MGAVQLWAHWQRCVATLERLADEANKAHTPFVVPGLRRLLALAGVVGVRGPAVMTYDPADDLLPEGYRTMLRRCGEWQGGCKHLSAIYARGS